MSPLLEVVHPANACEPMLNSSLASTKSTNVAVCTSRKRAASMAVAVLSITMYVAPPQHAVSAVGFP